MNRKTRRNTKAKAPAGLRAINPAAALEAAKSSALKALDAGKEAGQTVRKAALAQVRRTRKAAETTVESAKARAVEAVSHLEHVFEQRVSRAAARLGIPTANDVQALARQVAQLQASVERLRRTRARSAA